MTPLPAWLKLPGLIAGAMMLLNNATADLPSIKIDLHLPGIERSEQQMTDKRDWSSFTLEDSDGVKVNFESDTGLYTDIMLEYLITGGINGWYFEGAFKTNNPEGYGPKVKEIDWSQLEDIAKIAGIIESHHGNMEYVEAIEINSKDGWTYDIRYKFGDYVNENNWSRVVGYRLPADDIDAAWKLAQRWLR